MADEDEDGWVAVSHKKPPPPKQKQPQKYKQQTQQQQQRSKPAKQQQAQQLTRPISTSTPIPKHGKHEASKQITPNVPKATTPPRPLPTFQPSPPKSILAYGESNYFELDDSTSDTLEAQPPGSKPRQKQTPKKLPQKPSSTTESSQTGTEEQEEPLTHFFALLPPEVTMYLLTFFDLHLLCEFSLVSKFCYSFAVDDAFWKPMFKRDWGERRGGGAVKRKKRIAPEKGKWRKRYLQLFLNKKNAEKDKKRADMRMLIYYTKTFNLNMKKARQANNAQFKK